MLNRIMAFSLLLLSVACSQTEKSEKKPDVLAAHIDSSIHPGDDFFMYANGNWIKQNPIPAEESSWGIGNAVNEELYERVRHINEIAVADKNPSSNTRLIAAFWQSGMDTLRIEKEALSPIQPFLNSIAGIQSKEGLQTVIADMHTKGMGPAFSSFVYNDPKNSEKMALIFWQGGLGMPNRDYYFKSDARTTNIRNAYTEHLKKMFLLLGNTEAIATQSAFQVMRMETRLANASKKLEDLRDPYANYNKMTVAGLEKLTPSINWNAYFKQIGLSQVDTVIVGQPAFFQTVQNSLQTASLDEWKAYLTWNLINFAAPYLHQAMVNQDFDFFRRTLRGVEKQRPRWKSVLDQEKNSIGEAVGQLFVTEYFNEKAKKRYHDMVEDIRSVLKTRIEQLSWMQDSTKQKALNKLATMKKKVGYPDKWKDFQQMKIKNQSYVLNVMAANEWWHQYELAKYGKPVDRDEWSMVPQEYNAYYNPSNNEIVLPAGIFTVPGYRDEELDDAVVYGYAGASTIGHEITHGFDDEGRQFDANGNLSSWWSKQDEEAFNRRAQVMVDQFNQYRVVDSLFINGKATLGENIADLGGVILGWEAFQKRPQYKEGKEIAGLSPAKRYFLGYALGWLGHSRKEALSNQILTDVHSPAQFRVNGPFADVDAFYQVFDVQPKHALYRPDSTRVRIW
jgi:putative endopeptidase